MISRRWSHTQRRFRWIITRLCDHDLWNRRRAHGSVEVSLLSYQLQLQWVSVVYSFFLLIECNIVFNIFLLFFKSKETTFKTRKNVYFTSKALFILEMFKFCNFRILNFMTSSNASEWNKKYILLNDLGKKHNLVMKYGRFMHYYKRKKKSNFMAPFCGWGSTVSRLQSHY